MLQIGAIEENFQTEEDPWQNERGDSAWDGDLPRSMAGKG